MSIGKLRRIWRVPGRWANIALYDVVDATELTPCVTSLPLWPWMDVSVESLADQVILEAGNPETSGEDEVRGR